MSDLKYFRGSFIFTIIGLVLAFWYQSLAGLGSAAILAVLEVSLSFDNTVINATVLKDMDQIWRKRFITWGLLIAVFGMRIVFPIIIVSIVALINPIAAVKLAAYHPQQYANYMTQAHTPLMAFGGAFLLMVSLSLWIHDEKDVHWLVPIEKLLQLLDKIKFSAVIITVIVFCIMGLVIPKTPDIKHIVLPAIAGLAVFLIIEKVSEYMESKEEAREAQVEHEHEEQAHAEETADGKKVNLTTVAAKNGLAMFIYLEVLDSSFSFDGVIGAFAITTNMIIIAIGLGIGALFVRSMTIMLVDKGTLSEYKYLEHGAFYAIIALAITMFIQTFAEVPESITGCLGAFFIGVSFIHSLIVNKRNK